MIDIPKLGKSSGFSLVELLAVLLIYALIVGALIQAWSLYREPLRQEETRENMQLVSDSIARYASRVAVSRYPCPADPTLTPNAPSYGLEDCSGTNPNIIVVAGRDVNANNIVDPDERVHIGSVPFVTLNNAFDFQAEGIDQDGDGFDGEDAALINQGNLIIARDENTIDGWKNKLTYAVTEGLTVGLANNNENGAIYVGDEFAIPATPFAAGPPAVAATPARGSDITQGIGTAHFIIVSHGENGVGAFTHETGVQVSGGCALGVAANAALVNETENCDGDAVFLSGLSDIRANSHNDDTLSFIANGYQTYWDFTPTSTAVAPEIFNLNPGNVAMGGIVDPLESLHILGDIQASDIKTTQYCDATTGADCLPPDVIGGNLPAMECADARDVVIAIENNTVRCARPPTSPPVGEIRCNNNPMLGPIQVMVGITNTGNPVCDDL